MLTALIVIAVLYFAAALGAFLIGALGIEKHNWTAWVVVALCVGIVPVVGTYMLGEWLHDSKFFYKVRSILG